ncbi:MAG: GNAT family N-acetyltransferase [Dokdonella sp.]|uniref:GNAT family N-acetyltransferase n=1 Tax=Dokdonella sp. TaxID=2291710 RepID=UPI0032638295
MSSNVSLRDAGPRDVLFLVDSNRAMALETEGRRLSRDTLDRGVRAVFDQPGRGFYLIAEHDARAVGCLLITREWSDWRNGDWWWLQSVYVVPAARRVGVFRAMYREVERRAAVADVVGLRLYVDADNTKAKEVYLSLGMEHARYELFEHAARLALPDPASDAT